MRLATDTPAVPFLDLAALHEPITEPLLRDIAGIVERSAFANGPEVAAFEVAFARHCGAAHAVGTASGLDALRLALVAAGVGPGDEVLVPAGTFVATAEAVSQAGATPVLVDVRAQDATIDPDAAAAAVGPRTAAILPVHLYGQLADMRRLRALAARFGLFLLEDACQAHGARRDGLQAGAAGDAAAFSFYPGKNLGAWGDAGAMTTAAGDLAEQVRALREHGQRRKYHHDLVGYTSRLDTIQAAVLARKLPLLDGWTARRRAVAAGYARRLAGVGDLRLPSVVPGSEPVWHLYVVRTADPEALGAHLAARGVATGRHYPVPLHLTGAYASLGHPRGAFPVAEAFAAEGLSLPMHPALDDAQLDAVEAGVRSFFAGGSAGGRGDGRLERHRGAVSRQGGVDGLDHPHDLDADLRA